MVIFFPESSSSMAQQSFQQQSNSFQQSSVQQSSNFQQSSQQNFQQSANFQQSSSFQQSSNFQQSSSIQQQSNVNKQQTMLWVQIYPFISCVFSKKLQSSWEDKWRHFNETCKFKTKHFSWISRGNRKEMMDKTRIYKKEGNVLRENSSNHLS